MGVDLPDKSFFRIDEVAELFDLHHNTVRNWINEGMLDAVRLPKGTYRIPRSALVKLVTRRTRRMISRGIEE